MNIELIQDASLREMLESAMNQRKRVACVEEQAKKDKMEANEIITAVLGILGEDKVEWEGVGVVNKVVRNTYILDKDKLKDILVQRGVPVGVVSASFLDAETMKESVSIRFTQGKE